MQKLNNIQSYHPLRVPEAAVFAQAEGLTTARLVKMSIISEQDVSLKVTECSYTPETVTGEGEIIEAKYDLIGEPRLLSFVRAGFEEIQFYYTGSFVMNVVGGDIMVDTFDNAFVMTQATDFENYAIARERPEVDPMVLEMQRIARHNQAELEAQRQQDRAEMAALREQMMKEIKAGAVDQGTNNGGTKADAGTTGDTGKVQAKPEGQSAQDGAGGEGEPDASA